MPGHHSPLLLWLFPVFRSISGSTNWNLYVCFLVLLMKKTLHCLAEVFRQLTLRRMTAPLDQI